MKRYQEQGLAGLQVKPGRGRKAILSQDTDLAAVRLAVQNNRQRVSLAKAELHRTSPNFTELHRTSPNFTELQQQLGKEFSTLTLKRFLKKTVAASSEFDDK